MSPLAAFVLGLLVGWVVEWIIDWIYWRRRTAVSARQVEPLREEAKATEARNADLEHQLMLQKVDLTNLQEKLAAVEAELSTTRAANAARAAEAGPAATAQMESAPTRSAQVVSTEPPADEPVSPADMPASPANEPVSPAGEPASPANEPVAPADEPASPAYEPSSPAYEPAVSFSVPAVERDDLEVINGIGPVIAGKLYQAGINTFADLAVLTPTRLRELVGDIISRLADEDSIIEQAKQLAAKKRGG